MIPLLGLVLSPGFSFAQAPGAPPAGGAASTLERYEIRPGDLLEITVYPQAELSKTIPVFEDGFVTMPTVGRLRVVGLTREEAAKQVQESLSRYFVKPQVSLSIIKFSQRNVVISGEVRSSGVIPYVDGLTLSEVIGRAGGLGEDADKKTIRTFRGDPGKREVRVHNLDAILSGAAEDPKLQMGEFIEVPRLVNVIYVWGEVKSSGRQEFFVDMRMHDLIARAGGIQPFAKASAIQVFRLDGAVVEVNFSKVLKGDLQHNLELRPGDIVWVPHQSFARATGWIGLLSPWFNFISSVTGVIILIAVL